MKGLSIYALFFCLMLVLWGMPGAQAAAIHDAALKGDLTTVTRLVKKKPDCVNEKNTVGATPLHCAAFNGHIEVVKYLLDNRADINAVYQEIFTPLRIAIYDKKYHVALLLIERGANIKITSATGETFLHVAAERGSLEIVKSLLDKGAEIDARNSNDATPLIVAISHGDPDVALFLIERGANVNSKLTQGITCIHLAAAKNIQIVNALLDKDADALAVDIRGVLPIECATSEEICLALIQKEPRIVDALLTHLNDANVEKRRWATVALGRCREARAYDALAAQLADPNADLRTASAYALGRIADSRAVIPLTKLLQDEAPVVRVAAVSALGELKDHRAVDALIQHIGTTTGKQRSNVIASLNNCCTIANADSLLQLISSKDPEIIIVGINLFKQIKSTKGLSPMLSLIQTNADLQVINAAGDYLTQVCPQEATEELVKLLERSTDESVRGHAAYALAMMGPAAKAAIPMLVTTGFSAHITTTMDDQHRSYQPGHTILTGTPSAGGLAGAVLGALIVNGVKNSAAKARAKKAEADYINEEYGHCVTIQDMDLKQNGNTYAIHSTVLLHTGPYALYKITGQQFGKDQKKWTEWYQANTVK